MIRHWKITPFYNLGFIWRYLNPHSLWFWRAPKHPPTIKRVIYQCVITFGETPSFWRVMRRRTEWISMMMSMMWTSTVLMKTLMRCTRCMLRLESCMLRLSLEPQITTSRRIPRILTNQLRGLKSKSVKFSFIFIYFITDHSF